MVRAYAQLISNLRVKPMTVSNATSFEDVYRRLREIARRERRRLGAGNTLNTTALVHEVYIDMNSGSEATPPRDFYAYCARAMRNLIIDEARRRQRIKHGGDLQSVELDDAEPAFSEKDAQQAIDLDDALKTLSKSNARAAEVVELHYFAGLDLAEIAKLMEVSERTVNRDWRAARAWLKLQLA